MPCPFTRPRGEGPTSTPSATIPGPVCSFILARFVHYPGPGSSVCSVRLAPPHICGNQSHNIVALTLPQPPDFCGRPCQLTFVSFGLTKPSSSSFTKLLKFVSPGSSVCSVRLAPYRNCDFWGRRAVVILGRKMGSFCDTSSSQFPCAQGAQEKEARFS